MHRCWQVREILEQILDELYALHHTEESFGRIGVQARVSEDVLNFGLVCKVFIDPALDRLWYTVDTLVYLAQCLPANSWAVQAPSSGSQTTLVKVLVFWSFYSSLTNMN
jgi:hypothetical protein